ncbi:MAG: dihydropteroate synthase, partial [Pseudolabrys sp.]|nr:dihydropteroate synthase [Pseudolabrys sp.]
MSPQTATLAERAPASIAALLRRRKPLVMGILNVTPDS